MADNVPYIIGNVFDLHHGVNSSYGAFLDWLKVHDYETFNIYQTICDYDALWSDFETGMAFVSRDYFLEAGIAFLPDPKSDPDDWTAADMLLGGDTATSMVADLLDNLKKDFHKWVCSLKPPRDYKDKMLHVDDYARFLTFNYTTFLESHYGISFSKVDKPYLMKIVAGNEDKAKMQWYVSAFSLADHDRALECLISMGISEENIHFKQMMEFKIQK